MKNLLENVALNLNKDEKDGVDKERRYYGVRHTLFGQVAKLILSLPSAIIPDYLNCFTKTFHSERWIMDFLEAFIIQAIYSCSINNFWIAWRYIYDSVKKLCVKGDYYSYTSEILKTYLFATIKWNDNVTHWEAFRDDDTHFFERIANELGHCHSVFYSIAKLVSKVGMVYSDNAIKWLSGMLASHSEVHAKEVKSETIYYLEILCRRFAQANREKIRREIMVKMQYFTILNFLVNNGSITGFMLRESF